MEEKKRRLALNSEILKKAEATLWASDKRFKDAAFLIKVSAMTEISKLNREIYSK